MKQDISKLFGNIPIGTISDDLFNSSKVKFITIFHDTSDAWTDKPETKGTITFKDKDLTGEKDFKGSSILDVLNQMQKFLETVL